MRKRAPKIPSTEKELKDLALFYCSKRETSRPRLEKYLKRKIPRDQLDETKLGWIEGVLKEFERLKVIDHDRYAGMLVREYQRRGKGKRYVTQKLKEKGVAEKIKEFEAPADEELERAVELATKTLQRAKIQQIEDPFQKRQKVLQKLVTAGFDFDVSKQAVKIAIEHSENPT